MLVACGYVCSILFSEPSQPCNPRVRILSGSPTELELQWTPPEDINGELIAYTVYYFMFPHGVITKVSVLPTQTSVHVIGLMPYTMYGFYVTATNYVGEGEASRNANGVTDESGINN